MIEYLTAALLGLVLFYFYQQYSRRGRFLNKIHGPKIIPIFGNAWEVALPPAEIFKLLRNWGKKYYPIFRLWIFNTALIHIRHPDDLEAIFTSKTHIDKRFGYEYFSPWLKTGLLTSSGEKWHHRRKILTPAFHFNILQKHLELAHDHVNKFIAAMKSEGPEVKVDIVKFCMKFTLNVICESSMGVAVDGETDNESKVKYKDALDDMVNLIIYRMVRPYITDWNLIFLPALYKKTKNSIYQIDKFTEEIVQQRRKYHQDTNYKNLEQLQNSEDKLFDIYHEGKKKRLAMLDLLLLAEKKNLIDHKGIKEEVSTFIFEGHDTTAMSLAFTIMLLAEHEDIQSRVRREVEEVIKRSEGNINMADINDMTYLEMVVKESLRLYPSVPSITREMTEDLQLKHGLAPKGSDVVIHIVDVHRDPNFWPDPDKFDPDRFLPDQANKRHPFAYVPFSAGSRNCIGQRFARMEMKIFLSFLLYNYYFESIDRTCDIELVGDVIIRPSRPVHTKFIKIDRN